ncbi:hypothetical protein E2C01_069633 [Portunus trituberculatus]|uniref:Uncharacterized protein n=1 Tax=Portunus trituberculatus TaxID=210409 RepID=A0A5B7I036_PORTR|nr:hypothetical protein [Portunus trituberculatus]
MLPRRPLKCRLAAVLLFPHLHVDRRASNPPRHSPK